MSLRLSGELGCRGGVLSPRGPQLLPGSPRSEPNWLPGHRLEVRRCRSLWSTGGSPTSSAIWPTRAPLRSVAASSRAESATTSELSLPDSIGLLRQREIDHDRQVDSQVDGPRSRVQQAQRPEIESATRQVDPAPGSGADPTCRALRHGMNRGRQPSPGGHPPSRSGTNGLRPSCRANRSSSRQARKSGSCSSEIGAAGLLSRVSGLIQRPSR